MPLTVRESLKLQEIQAEISQIENRLAVSHGLGDSHSSQGLNASFSENMRWRSALSTLRAARDRLLMKEAGETHERVPGVNISNYWPT
jgi:hypothetical protein